MLENKPFEIGLFVGRFQHFHIGHELIVNTAFKLCKKLVILISDADESKTVKNPFDIEIREKLLREIYINDNVVIGRLNRFNNEDSIFDWRDYALSKVNELTSTNPNFIIYGSDVSFNPWFDTRGINNMLEIIVPRSNIEISATEIRRYLIEDDEKNWRKYTNEKIHKYYDLLRKELLKLEEIANNKRQK